VPRLIRYIHGVLGAWLVLGLELFVFATLEWRKLATVWELQMGTLWLAPTALLVAATLGALGAACYELVDRARDRRARFGLSVGAALFATLVALGVGGGRHLAELPARVGFASLTACALALPLYFLAPALANAIKRRPERVSLGVGLVIVGLELVNRFVLVRLYPAFHYGLSALALIVAAGLFRGSPAGVRQSELWPAFLTGAVMLLSAGLAKAGSERLSHFDNFRWLLLENAPLLGQAVRIAAELSPPPPLDDGACKKGADCEQGGPRQSQRTLDLAGRDFLLISIDALRADHVGAYGYPRKTTPNIDAIARSGAVFEFAYAQTPHTSYSVTSLMTGKYMRPLLLQGVAQDSDTWAGLFRTYGYRTAAFYPPAVFFIDPARFEPFQRNFLGFEYRWVEFSEGTRRIEQVRQYLASAPHDKPLFVWVHLFGPHEPYEPHAAHDFGERDVDRYDSEIAQADETVGALVEIFQASRKNAVTLITADHGEEFGEHGGRYHGTSVYEEQVRVPLVISAPGAIKPQKVVEVVQTIDILPTLLTALDIPAPPRIRGRDLGSLLSGQRAAEPGLAYAETEEQVLLAEGSLRLVCARKIGACKLFDLRTDPAQARDLAGERSADLARLRTRLRDLSASHGRYEQSGLRAEGKGWPAPILRGIGGDADAAEEIASLLDDADRVIRRKAGELLFELRRPETAAPLRLALARDEDEEVRRWCALALTRLGEGAPLVYELLYDRETRWQRFAALALAQSGDRRGEETLIAWWRDKAERDYARSRQLLDVFGALRTKDAIWPLVQALDDVRLRPHIATTLSKIGGELARGSLLDALHHERFQSTRVALATALVDLETGAAMATALVRFLGVPDPLPGGLALARRGELLDKIGGPEKGDLRRLERESMLGVGLMLTVPPGGNGRGVRALVRARAAGPNPGEVLFGVPTEAEPTRVREGQPRVRKLPQIDPGRSLHLSIPAGVEAVEVYGTLPESAGARPGQRSRFAMFADRSVTVEAVALVPLADELAPPPPEPWKAP
jgi:arylsulfatase A-like enzyme